MVAGPASIPSESEVTTRPARSARISAVPELFVWKRSVTWKSEPEPVTAGRPSARRAFFDGGGVEPPPPPLAKRAVTVVAAWTTIVHDVRVPLHAPPQPTKCAFADGVAASAT